MNFKNLLPAALVGLIGVSTPACKSSQEKYREDVNRILESVQPTNDMLQVSQQYYENREDLKSIALDDKVSLAL